MIKDCESFLSYMKDEIRKQTDIAVVGMSGGADSSLTTTLCVQALGKESVYGISMPFNEFDEKTFNARSSRLAERLRINHYVKAIRSIADAINDQIYLDSPDELTDVNKGNGRSRARMCVLYGVAHNLSARFPDKRVRVIGTGNLSEDFIGYDTKGGDALADFFPIGELFKSEVYQFLEYFRDLGVIDEDHIDRTPSAGLETGQTDEADLGHTYANMEKAIRFCRANYSEMPKDNMDEVTRFVWHRHLTQKHKHEAPVVIQTRHFCE